MKDGMEEFKEDTHESFRLVNIKLEDHNAKLDDLLRYKWLLGILVVAAPQIWPVVKSIVGFGGK